MKITNAPRALRSVRAAQLLFFLNCAIWLVFATVVTIRIMNNQNITPPIVAVLMFGNACAMLIVGLGIATLHRWWYFLGIAVLAVNILLTITDEFGFFDFITLLIDVALLGLLIITRAQYLIRK
jgi:hypothetical protein